MRIPGTIIILLSALGVLSMPAALLASEAAVEVADQFKCPVCHISRLREFKRDEVPTLIPREPRPELVYGRQNEASTPEMCFSCHDGYVLDSRALWKDGHLGHPVGISPTSDTRGPLSDGEPEFPLNDAGKLYCGTCHSGHLGDGKAATAPTFMRLSSEHGQLCSACHTDKQAVLGSPHQSSADKRKPGVDFNPRGLCGNCHAPHQAKGPALWARNPGQGNTPVNTLCRSCHKEQPDPAEHPSVVMAWSQNLRNGLRSDPGVEMPVFDDRARVTEIGSIGCATCHDPHRHAAQEVAEENGYFLRRGTTQNFLCADCHAQRSLYLYQFFHTRRGRH